MNASHGGLVRTAWLSVIWLLTLLMAAPARAQVPTQPEHLHQPVYRVANETTGSAASADEAQTEEHPLVAAVRFAKTGLEKIDGQIRDYSCTLIKRERVNGTLNPHEYIFAKIRHEPFSVYMYFLGPTEVKGRECIYVEGRNEGKLIAHEGKGLKAKLGVFKLDPKGMLAMRGQKYPITEVGIRNLTARLIDVAEHDSQFGECQVQWYKDTKVDNRKCTCLQVVHPVPRPDFRFHLARVFVDEEHQVPIRYESYRWPVQPNDQPILDEEYTYVNIKTNNGFTDSDFEERNPNYRFE